MDMFTADNKVNPAFIEQELSQVVMHVHVPEGSTTTVATAFDQDGFQLAVGTSGCVDPANFDAEKGKQIACENATKAAKDKLWELYGFMLHKTLAAE